MTCKDALDSVLIKKNIEQTSVPKYTFPLWVLQEAVSERDITI